MLAKMISGGSGLCIIINFFLFFNYFWGDACMVNSVSSLLVHLRVGLCITFLSHPNESYKGAY